jgi:hypothetical protein
MNASLSQARATRNRTHTPRTRTVRVPELAGRTVPFPPRASSLRGPGVAALPSGHHRATGGASFRRLRIAHAVEVGGSCIMLLGFLVLAIFG